MEDHQYLEIVVKTLRENQLFAKHSKCKFRMGEVDCLGHIISGQEMRIDS